MSVEGFTLNFEIETEIPRPKPVVVLSIAVEFAQGFTRALQIRRTNFADGLDYVHLNKFIELVELAHALFGKSNLVHVVLDSAGKEGEEIVYKRS